MLDGVALRAYGSQGQQRAALLALLFAERELLAERRARLPLMLLDDVMSELDAERRELLADLLRGGGQAVITATEPEHVPGTAARGEELVRVGGGTHRGNRAGDGGVRRLAPRPLSVALDAVVAEAEPATALARAQAAWPEVAGPALRSFAQPVAERDGVLTLACESAVWAQELEFMGADLLDRMNAAMAAGGAPATSFRRLRFVVGSPPN